MGKSKGKVHKITSLGTGKVSKYSMGKSKGKVHKITSLDSIPTDELISGISKMTGRPKSFFSDFSREELLEALRP